MTCDRRSLQHLLAGVAFGSLTLGGPAVAADLALKAPAYKAVYDWTGFYLGGHVGYGDGSIGPDTNPLPLQGVFFPPSVTGIDRRLSGRLSSGNCRTGLCSASRPTSRSAARSTCRGWCRHRSTPPSIMSRPRAAGSAMRCGTLDALCHGRRCLGRTPMSPSTMLGDHSPPKRYLTHAGWTAGAGHRGRGRRQLDREGRIRLHRSGAPDLRPDRCRLAARQCRSQHPPVQARAELPAVGDPAMGGPVADRDQRRCPNRPTGTCTRRPRSSRKPIRACASPYEGHQQPSGWRPGSRDLDRGRVSRLAALAGRRVLFQPRTGAGFWPQRHARARRLLRTARPRRPARRFRNFGRSAISSRQTFGLGGEQEEVADAANQLAGKRDIDRVTVTVGRFAVGDYLRRQLLRQGSPRRFHELGDVVVGGLRLPCRPARLHPRRRGRTQPQGLGAARRPVPGAQRAQQRRPRLQDRRRRGRIRGAAHDLRSARQAAARRLRQSRQHRQLSPGAGDRANGDPTLDINDVMPSIRHDNPKYGFYANVEQQIDKGRRPVRPRQLERRPATKSCPSPMSTAACLAACRSRAAIGAVRPTPSVSAAPSTVFPRRIAISWRRAASVS